MAGPPFDPTAEAPAEVSELKRRLGQREAELQIINSVQLGLAEHLDVQSIYDWSATGSATSSMPRWS